MNFHVFATRERCGGLGTTRFATWLGVSLLLRAGDTCGNGLEVEDAL